MRFAFTLLHRWVGLAIAVFLFVSGVTGAVISWDHELDDILNPHLMEARGSGPTMSSLELARQVEARDPRVQAVAFPLAVEPGESLSIFVLPRVDAATGRLYEPGYNQVFLDPATGQELGRREWGAAWPISRENLVSFLYKLHYSLHIPEFWGIDRWGEWLLGGIAILWTLDCFIGFYLTTPARHAPNAGRPAEVERALRRGWWARWKPAWRIKMSGSAYRLNFDIHRAFGLWTWLLLFVLAFTAFSLNLYREIFYPVMSTVSQVTPDPFATRAPTEPHKPIEPTIGYAEIIEKGRAEGVRRGWSEPVGGVFYAPQWGIYGVRFFEAGDDHGAAGVGPAALYYDGRDGRLLGDRQPWKGTVADIFVQAQFPIHSGRILGLPGRIVISVMGLVVAALSVTGVVIWWRKRCARLAVRRSRPGRDSLAASPAE
jgi:uncharacterized iron-regulated membrane protein